MKSPDFSPILNDFNILDFHGSSEQEVKRSIASLLGGLVTDYGVAATSALFIGTFPHNSQVAEIIKDTSTLLISGVSLATLLLTYFHATFAQR